MSKSLLNNLPNLVSTPQSEKAREDQVENNAGGFVFQVPIKARLERFLILGIDGGTYYVNEKDLFKTNYDFIVELIKTDPALVLHTAVEVSDSGRAYRNDAALFVLALLFRYAPESAKTEIRANFNKIVRTSYHLFTWAKYIEAMRDGTGEGHGGWSRSKRSAVADWYNAKTVDAVAYQLVKYRQRDGWTHKDVLRLSHAYVAKPLANFILEKPQEPGVVLPNVLTGFQDAQEQQNIEGLLHVLDLHKNLPWEAVPTQFHKNVELWKKLFYNNQLTGQALLRNITRLAKLNAFDDMVFARDVATALTSEVMIRRTRLHPIQYLLAIVNYTEGQVKRDKRFGFSVGVRVMDWTPNPVIVDALNDGFYLAFQYVEPADKKTLIGLDVSGSMSGLAAGIDLSCAQVGAAMSMSVARREPYYQIMGFANEFRDLGISPNMTLPEVMRRVQDNNFGSTDCALPMLWAKDKNIDVETFVVMTDNETWAGRRAHPYQALEQYRQHVGHDAKLVVLAMTATQFTIANPADRGMLDICGCDSSVPQLVADFSADRI